MAEGRGTLFLRLGKTLFPPPTKKGVWAWIQPKSIAVLGDLLRKLRAAIEQRTGAREAYPVVIINWVQYLGPPVPFSFPYSRDLLEVLEGLPWQRETPREDPLGSGRIP